MFSKGFAAPLPDRDLTGPGQYMAQAPYSPGDAGDKLDLKDPVAYLKMVKKNLEELKKVVTNQQEAIIGDGGPLQKHIADTTLNYQNAETKSKELASDCLAAYDSYKTLLENQQKMATDKANADQKAYSELGEAKTNLCSTYTRVMSDSPDGACKVFEANGKAALLATGKSGGDTTEINTMIMTMDERCKGGGDSESSDAGEICTKTLPTEFQTYFAGKFKGKSITIICDLAYSPLTEQSDLDLAKILCTTTPEEAKPFTQNRSTPPAATTLPSDASGYSCPSTPWMYVGIAQNIEPTAYIYSKSCIKNVKPDCTNLQKKIVDVYKAGRSEGKLYSDSQAGDTPATCTASNNSGPYNTKNWMNPGNSNNPMANGGSGTVGY